MDVIGNFVVHFSSLLGISLLTVSFFMLFREFSFFAPSSGE